MLTALPGNSGVRREVPKLSEDSGKRRAGADFKYCKLAGFFALGDQ
jgi:hypothetical protein